MQGGRGTTSATIPIRRTIDVRGVVLATGFRRAVGFDLYVVLVSLSSPGFAVNVVVSCSRHLRVRSGGFSCQTRYRITTKSRPWLIFTSRTYFAVSYCQKRSPNFNTAMRGS